MTIRTPIQPIIFHGLCELLMRDFSCTLDQAIPLAERLIHSLRSKDLDIVRGNWMEEPPIKDEPRQGRGRQSWEQLAQDADEWVNSPSSPMNRAELR